MSEHTNQEQSVELLQQLGLKEYEARCFVALCRLPSGSAKQVSEISEVPRTRIYDAIRVLEAKGLVEVQHSSPKQFRAVSVQEAAETLREDYVDRTDALLEELRSLDGVTVDDETDVTHEVWALSGGTAIGNRVDQLLADATEEIVFVVGHEEALTSKVVETLRDERANGVNVIVGTLNESLQDRVQTQLPAAETFVSGLEWLDAAMDDTGDDTVINRLLLVDRRSILVSTRHASGDGIETTEKAIFGTGFTNGLVVVARRLMSTGLRSRSDPGLPE
jgi:sugar-specific transcriptional regulator TrmB